MKYGFGVDLGGTTVKIAYFDTNGTMLSKWEIPTIPADGGKQILPDIAQSIRDFITGNQINESAILGLGIGVPGPVDAKGVVNKCVNLGWGVFNIAQELSDLTGFPVKAGNDANVAALGEYWKGGGQGCDNMVFATLGTGVGGGVILDNRMLVGCNYAGAELGHMVIVKDGKECGCGRKGCWEAYASATGLINLTKQKILSGKLDYSYMLKQCDGDINKVNGKTAFDAAAAGDPDAQEVLDEYFGYLATGLVNIINIFQPDVLCIGGGISNQGENLLSPLRKIIEEERYTKHNDKQTKLCTCTLANVAGIIGAAFLD